MSTFSTSLENTVSSLDTETPKLRNVTIITKDGKVETTEDVASKFGLLRTMLSENLEETQIPVSTISTFNMEKALEFARYHMKMEHEEEYKKELEVISKRMWCTPKRYEQGREVKEDIVHSPYVTGNVENLLAPLREDQHDVDLRLSGVPDWDATFMSQFKQESFTTEEEKKAGCSIRDEVLASFYVDVNFLDYNYLLRLCAMQQALYIKMYYRKN